MSLRHILVESEAGFILRSDPALVDDEPFAAHDRALAHARLRRLEHGGVIVDETSLAVRKAGRG